KQAGREWPYSASYALLQMLANPWTNIVVETDGLFVPRLICRPCHGLRWGYEINGIKVADFVLPAWFEDSRPANGARYDRCGHIKAPFQILRGGYLMIWGGARCVLHHATKTTTVKGIARGKLPKSQLLG